jgi:hypothetical protein
MSEFQYVAFRAIDGPVSEKNLAYMRQQSTRAEITPLAFDNQYHFGDFRGDALEMLRRGYDIHLHYADFGIRRLLIRFPHGLPDPKAAKPYWARPSLCFKKDESGKGGSLRIQPWHEPGDSDDLGDVNELIDRLAPVRAEILEGDLRPLYLAHLAIVSDGEHNPEISREAPVPAGLKQLSDAQQALAEYLGLDETLLAAAAVGSPATLARSNSTTALLKKWLSLQPEAARTEWLMRLLSDGNSSVRADMLAEFRSAHRAPIWPTVNSNRTVDQLRAAAKEIAHERKQEAAAARARLRAARLKKMATRPEPFLRETEQLTAKRTTAAYRQAGELLSELREALADGKHSELANHQAEALRKKHPTARGLIAELRGRGLIVK